MQPRSFAARSPVLAAQRGAQRPLDWGRLAVWGGIFAGPWTALVLLVHWLLGA